MSSIIENNEDPQTSAAKKAAKLANDAVVITAIAVSVIGLGKLAYDSAEIGISSFKNWKNNRKNNTEN
jgi:hypothetical protein